MNDINKSLWSSKWYQLKDSMAKKNFLYLIKITQKEVAYSAVGVVPLCLETFTDVATILNV